MSEQRSECEHKRTGYCFDCMREQYSQDEDADFDYASTPHPRAYYDDGELIPPD